MEGTANQVIPEGSAQLYPTDSTGRSRADDNHSLLIQVADPPAQPIYFYCGGRNRQMGVL